MRSLAKFHHIQLASELPRTHGAIKESFLSSACDPSHCWSLYLLARTGKRQNFLQTSLVGRETEGQLVELQRKNIPGAEGAWVCVSGAYAESSRYALVLVLVRSVLERGMYVHTSNSVPTTLDSGVVDRNLRTAPALMQ